nr:integrase, catalytic region, zinc finger, CCHC-type, peptidase aspartic, catalytic [Tanacetum cinerariifolium]
HIQTRTKQLPHDIRKSNKRVSFSRGVIPTTSVSRPQLKRNPLEDRVMLNNSQGKKQEVEDYHRNVKFSRNKTSVTACNDSLNAKNSNVNFVCVTCGKCVLNGNHDMCVLHSHNGVNSRTKMPMAMPISTREPKRIVNQSVAKPLRRIVASESTNQKPRRIIRKLYKSVSKTCSWWYPKFTPPGYTWKPNSQTGNLVEIILFIVDSGCSKHITGNLKLLTNFMEKFLGTVKFGNDQIAPILGYGDLVQGTVIIKRVYYVEGLNHNLFFIGQFYDADLEVAFWKYTCYIRDLKGNDLLTGSRGTDLYLITLQDTSSPNLICLMGKASSDGENLDKMKEKGDASIFVGYFTQSRAYRVFNKKTRVMVETIHVNFDELPQMALDHISSDPVPQCQRTALEHVSLSPDPQCQENVPHTAEIVTTSNELDLLFSLMFDELLNGSSKIVSKSSAVTATDAPHQRQQHNTTPLNTQTTSEPTSEIVTTSNELDLLFSLMFDELLNGSSKIVSKSSADCTLMSSAKVEYVSLSACCAQVLWLRTQLTDYGFHFDKIPMYCDSKAAIAISCNPVQHLCTKDIDVRFHFIKEKVEKCIVELFFVETEYQLADMFTKALPEESFKYLVRHLV